MAHDLISFQIDVDLFTCSVCKTFKTVNPSKLENHMQIHRDEKSFKCGTCDKAFNQLSQLRNHSVTHMDKNSDLVLKF